MDYSALLSRSRQRNLRKPIRRPNRGSDNISEGVPASTMDAQTTTMAKSLRQNYELSHPASYPPPRGDGGNYDQTQQQSQQSSPIPVLKASSSGSPIIHKVSITYREMQNPAGKATIPQPEVSSRDGMQKSQSTREMEDKYKALLNRASRRDGMQKSQSTREMEDKYKTLLNRSRRRRPKRPNHQQAQKDKLDASSYDKNSSSSDDLPPPTHGPAHKETMESSPESRGSRSRSNRSNTSARTYSSPQQEPAPQTATRGSPSRSNRSSSSMRADSSPQQETLPQTETRGSPSKSNRSSSSVRTDSSPQQETLPHLETRGSPSRSNGSSSSSARIDPSPPSQEESRNNNVPSPQSSIPVPPSRSHETSPTSSSRLCADSTLSQKALQSEVAPDGSMNSRVWEITGESIDISGAGFSVNSRAVKLETSMGEADEAFSRRIAELQGDLEASLNSRGAGTQDDTIVSLGQGFPQQLETTPDDYRNSRTGDVSTGEAHEIVSRGQGNEKEWNDGLGNDEAEGQASFQESPLDGSSSKNHDGGNEDGTVEQFTSVLDPWDTSAELRSAAPDPEDTDSEHKSSQPVRPEDHFFDPNSSEEMEQPSLESTDHSSIEVEYVDDEVEEDQPHESECSFTEVEYAEDEMSVEASVGVNQSPIEDAEKNQIEVNRNDVGREVSFQSHRHNNASEGPPEVYEKEPNAQREASITNKDLLNERNPSSFTVPSFFEDSHIEDLESISGYGDSVQPDSADSQLRAEDISKSSPEIRQGEDRRLTTSTGDRHGSELVEGSVSHSTSRSPQILPACGPDSSLSSVESETREDSYYSPDRQLMKRVEIERTPGSSSSDESSDDEMILDSVADLGGFPVANDDSELIRGGGEDDVEQPSSPLNDENLVEVAMGVVVDEGPTGDIAISLDESVSSTGSMKTRSFAEVMGTAPLASNASNGEVNASNAILQFEETDQNKQNDPSQALLRDADEMINARYGQLTNKHILDSVLSSREANENNKRPSESIFSKEKDSLMASNGRRDDRSLIFPWERWELRKLLLLWADGHNVDKARLHELGLLEKWMRCEDLTTDEAKYVEDVRKRRRLLQDHYKGEFQLILQGASLGELATEDRMNYLQLYARRAVGDLLTLDEVDELNSLEKEDEEMIIREFNEGMLSASARLPLSGGHMESPSETTSTESTRASDRFYMEEFEDIIVKCENGESVDEKRFGYLQLYGRSRIGQELTADEMSRLQSFLDTERRERLSFSIEETDIKAVFPPPPLETIELMIETKDTVLSGENVLGQDELKMKKFHDLIRRKLLSVQAFDEDNIDAAVGKVMRLPKAQIKVVLQNPLLASLTATTESTKNNLEENDGYSSVSSRRGSDNGDTSDDDDNDEAEKLSQDEMMMRKIRSMVREKLLTAETFNLDNVDTTVDKLMKRPRSQIRTFLQNPLPEDLTAPTEEESEVEHSEEPEACRSSSPEDSEVNDGDEEGGEKELSQDEIIMNKIRSMVREKLLTAETFDEDNVDTTVDKLMKLPRPQIIAFLQNPLPEDLTATNKKGEGRQSEESEACRSSSSEDSETSDGDEGGGEKQLSQDEIIMNKIRSMVREKLLTAESFDEDNVDTTVDKLMKLPRPQIRAFLQNPLPEGLTATDKKGEDGQSEDSEASRNSSSEDSETSDGDEGGGEKQLSQDEIIMNKIRGMVREKLLTAESFDEDNVDARVDKLMKLPRPQIRAFLQNPLPEGLTAQTGPVERNQNGDGANLEDSASSRSDGDDSEGGDDEGEEKELSQDEITMNKIRSMVREKLLTAETFDEDNVDATVDKLMKLPRPQIGEFLQNPLPEGLTAPTVAVASNQEGDGDFWGDSISGHSDRTEGGGGDDEGAAMELSKDEAKRQNIRDLVKRKMLSSSEAFDEDYINTTLDKVMELPQHQIETFFPATLGSPTTALRKRLEAGHVSSEGSNTGHSRLTLSSSDNSELRDGGDHGEELSLDEYTMNIIRNMEKFNQVNMDEEVDVEVIRCDRGSHEGQSDPSSSRNHNFDDSESVGNDDSKAAIDKLFVANTATSIKKDQFETGLVEESTTGHEKGRPIATAHLILTQSSASSSTSKSSSSSSSSSASSSSREFMAPSEIEFISRDFSVPSPDGSSAGTSTMSDSSSSESDSNPSSSSDSSSSSSYSSGKDKKFQISSAEETRQPSAGTALFEDDELSPSIDATELLPFVQLDLSVTPAIPYGIDSDSSSESSDEYGFDKGSSKSASPENPFQRNWNGNLPYQQLQAAGEGTVEEDRSDSPQESLSWIRTPRHQAQEDNGMQQIARIQDSPKSTDSAKSLEFETETDTSTFALKGKRDIDGALPISGESKKHKQTRECPSEQSLSTSSESSGSAERESRYASYRNFLSSTPEKRIWSSELRFSKASPESSGDMVDRDLPTRKDSKLALGSSQPDSPSVSTRDGSSLTGDTEVAQAICNSNGSARIKNSSFIGTDKSEKTGPALVNKSAPKSLDIDANRKENRNVTSFSTISTESILNANAEQSSKEASSMKQSPKIRYLPEDNDIARHVYLDGRASNGVTIGQENSNQQFQKAKELFSTLQTTSQSKSSLKPSFLRKQSSKVHFIPEEDDHAGMMYGNSKIKDGDETRQETSNPQFKEATELFMPLQNRSQTMPSPKPALLQAQSSKITYIPEEDDHARMIYRGELDIAGKQIHNETGLLREESSKIRYIPEEDAEARKVYRMDEFESKKDSQAKELESLGTPDANHSPPPPDQLSTKDDSRLIQYIPDEDDHARMIYRGGELESEKEVKSQSVDNTGPSPFTAHFQRTAFLLPESKTPRNLASNSVVTSETYGDFSKSNSAQDKTSAAERAILKQRKQAAQAMASAALSKLSNLAHVETQTTESQPFEMMATPEIPRRQSIERFHLSPLHVQNLDVYTGSVIVDSSSSDDEVIAQETKASWSLLSMFKLGKAKKATKKKRRRARKQKIETISGAIADIQREEFKRNSPPKAGQSNDVGEELKKKLGNIELRHVHDLKKRDPTRGHPPSLISMQGDPKSTLESVQLRSVPAPQHKDISTTAKPNIMQGELQQKMTEIKFRAESVPKRDSVSNTVKPLSMEDELKSKLANRQLRSVPKQESPRSASKPISLEDELKNKLANRQLRPVPKRERPTNAAKPISLEGELKNKLANRQLRPVPKRESPASNTAKPISMQDELKYKLVKRQAHSEYVPNQASPINAKKPISMQDELKNKLTNRQLRSEPPPKAKVSQKQEPKRMVQLRPTKLKTNVAASMPADSPLDDSPLSYDADVEDQKKNFMSSSIARKKVVHFQLPSNSAAKPSMQLSDPVTVPNHTSAKARLTSQGAESHYDVEATQYSNSSGTQNMESPSVSSSESSPFVGWSPSRCTTFWQLLVRTLVCLLLLAAIAIPVYFLQFHDRNVPEKDIGLLNLFPASEFAATESPLSSNNTANAVVERNNIFSHSFRNDP
ncbi:unnamed protein product [Cylindrotheca closterium]|uniref:Uncharacterized protein n=1 Tax=Cylindrotheca closterium TaxID=2856 RepID=A0AAD2CE87_9STRA|nr:unnamed protein product [Cylindrotheca closterium]